MQIDELRAELASLAETGYRTFQEKLVPDTENILGVRIPALRAMARRIAREDAQAFLAQADERSMEETILQGLVIGYARMPDAERLRLLASFVPKIRNWAVCDTCAATYKFMAKERAQEVVWRWLRPYHNSEGEFACRFALVCAMDHFLDGTYLDRVLDSLASYGSHAYYADMAAAWSVSVCWVRAPEKTRALLERGVLKPFTQNMAIRKICESYRVPPEQKALARTLRREA